MKTKQAQKIVNAEIYFLTLAFSILTIQHFN